MMCKRKVVDKPRRSGYTTRMPLNQTPARRVVPGLFGFAVRSFAVGKPGGRESGFPVRESRRWRAPDSYYLPLPVTLVAVALCLPPKYSPVPHP